MNMLKIEEGFEFNPEDGGSTSPSQMLVPNYHTAQFVTQDSNISVDLV
jgi:hypothetical protein